MKSNIFEGFGDIETTTTVSQDATTLTIRNVEESPKSSNHLNEEEKKLLLETTTSSVLKNKSESLIISDESVLNLDNIDTSTVEPKDFLADLENIHKVSQSNEDLTHSVHINLNKVTEEKNMPNAEGGAEILNKVQNNVDQLRPAKLKKRHRIPKEFECRRLLQSIPYDRRCDRRADCEDGTDELDCTCTDYITRFESNLLCDGVFDCADGQDELDCVGCEEDQFLCRRSQLCLPSKFVCDGKSHCLQGEDEQDCFALTNGQSMLTDMEGKPEVQLEGYVTKRHSNDWHIVCEDNLTIEQQERAAVHICRYLGFSSANRYLVKHINIKEDEILKSSEEDSRNRRETKEGESIHFAYRKVENDIARNVVIKDPEVLKEQCVPNVTKTCMSLYVFCDHSLFTNFDLTNNGIFNREVEDISSPLEAILTHKWPWIAKIYAEGNYKCTGVLVELSWVLVSHSCLWDSLLSHNHITAVLGSHRTSSTKGTFEQVIKVDAKKDLYRSKVALLHLKQPAKYSNMVKPMIVPSPNALDDKETICVTVGQDENNRTVGVFLEETNDRCDLHSRCFIRRENETICDVRSEGHRLWAGIISCHSSQGWYPAASFVDSRGECGVGDTIISTDIGNLKMEMKHVIGKFISSIPEAEEHECTGHRCSRGRCVKLAVTCDGVNDCEDGGDESEAACQKKDNVCTRNPHHKGCECSSGQLKCRNGKCVAKEMYQDGNDDCGDGTDEPMNNACSHYLARVEPSSLCDGILHCQDRSDEDPYFCKCFAKKSFKCGKNSSAEEMCVAPDMVCDGVVDCPLGDDEQTCVALSAPEGSTYGTGQVIVRSHGVWHSKCFPTPNHSKSELEAICRSLGFISGHAKQLETPIEAMLTTPFNSFIVDPFSDVTLNNKTRITLRNSDSPIAKAIVDATLKQCFPVFIECL